MIDDERSSELRENPKSTLRPPSVSTDQTSPMRSRLRKSDISLGRDQGGINPKRREGKKHGEM